MSRPVDVPAFLQIEPTSTSYDGTVYSAKVARVTSKQPRDPKPGVVLVKVTLRLPASVFEPLMPTALVEVPERDVVPIVLVENPEADQ